MTVQYGSYIALHPMKIWKYEPACSEKKMSKGRLIKTQLKINKSLALAQFCNYNMAQLPFIRVGSNWSRFASRTALLCI